MKHLKLYEALQTIEWPENIKFKEINLPDVEHQAMPTIWLYKENIKKFRDGYLILLSFVACICETDPENLTLFHILSYLAKHAKKERVK
ncbi:MAG: hypothetical protein B5M53_06275 [Candidatus Cloacimonas sp. 4484_209]|nr:MAG: hypothetical protein B5M53_06275 [Candidatus Cloacimonas sp. 4484_209]